MSLAQTWFGRTIGRSLQQVRILLMLSIRHAQALLRINRLQAEPRHQRSRAFDAHVVAEFQQGNRTSAACPRTDAACTPRRSPAASPGPSRPTPTARSSRPPATCPAVRTAGRSKAARAPARRATASRSIGISDFFFEPVELELKLADLLVQPILEPVVLPLVRFRRGRRRRVRPGSPGPASSTSQSGSDAPCAARRSPPSSKSRESPPRPLSP